MKWNPPSKEEDLHVETKAESKPKQNSLNLPMIVMNSLPGLGLLIEADQWPNPYIAQRCLEEKRPVLQFIRCVALGRRPGDVLYVSTDEEGKA
jgi:hypothetical protein